MSDELRQAVERLRRMKAGDGLLTVYGGIVETRGHETNLWLCDRAICADAYLADIARREQEYAEHPDESIDECLEFIECVPIEASRNPAVVAEWWGRYRALAKHVRAELVQRKQEQAERALPVTEDWLRSIGFEGNETDFLQKGPACVCLWENRAGAWCFYMDGCCGPDPLCRGHVLDLLSALGAGKGCA